MAKLLNCPGDHVVLRCIKNQEDFQVEGVKQKMSVSQVERLLEKEGYSVRVKTKGREASLLLPPLWALNASIQAAHAIMTYDPDWVIYKDMFGSKIHVRYFRKDT